MASEAPCIYVDGSDEPKLLPYKWTICSRCDGEGSSSAYLGAFTRADMDDDPEFFEQYMEGAYDRPCDHCDGTGKVKIVDEERCPPADLAAYRDEQEADREIDAIQRQEMMMEGGWRDMEGYR